MAVRMRLDWGSEEREGRQPACQTHPDGSARVARERGMVFSMFHVCSPDLDMEGAAWVEGQGGSVAEGTQLSSCP